MAGQHPGQCDGLAGPGPCRTAGGQGPGGREHVHLPVRGSDPGTAMWPRRLRCLLNASGALRCATRCPCLGWNPNGRKSCPCLAPDCQVSAGRGAHAQGLQRQGVEGTAPGSGCPAGVPIGQADNTQVSATGLREPQGGALKSLVPQDGSRRAAEGHRWPLNPFSRWSPSRCPGSSRCPDLRGLLGA